MSNDTSEYFMFHVCCLVPSVKNKHGICPHSPLQIQRPVSTCPIKGHAWEVNSLNAEMFINIITRLAASDPAVL